jgi:uncharacterized membrane protein
MSNGQPNEVEQLRAEVRALQQRVNEISRKLDGLSAPSAPPIVEPPPKIAAPPVIAAVPPRIVGQPPRLPSAGEAPAPPTPKESLEVRVGTFWLPRIAIVLILTGMVFFAAYYLPRMTVGQKVSVGYAVCAVLGGLGVWLEKKMQQFARVLQAGALALTYFVTYAAHFSENFRVIESPAVALALLSVVVLAIVGIAQRRQSPTLAGMALFLGYYTSVVSGVTSFTLAANVMLAAAALFFLARNRWVAISYGAVAATYVAYAIWVWKLARDWDVERLIFESGYLGAEDFSLRAAFLSVYWLLFALGGLIVRRDAMGAEERNGLLTLNNILFFGLFSLLMHHAHPDLQWQFQFSFAAALLIHAALSAFRFQGERAISNSMLVQGLAVGTLGVVTYFKGAQLVAALALESALLLAVSRWMNSRGVAWIARAVFAVLAIYAWNQHQQWDQSLIYSAWFAAAVGLACARLEKRATESKTNGAALYFAVVATILAVTTAGEQIPSWHLPWAWTCGAVAVALVGAILRSREVAIAAHLPLALAHAAFYASRYGGRAWQLDQSLALVAVTFGFGVTFWAWARAKSGEDDAKARENSTKILRPYAFFAVAAALVATATHCPAQWRLGVFAAEMLVLIVAGVMMRERTFAWLSAAVMSVGALHYLGGNWEIFRVKSVAWANAAIAVLLFLAAERVVKSKGQNLNLNDAEQRRVRVWIMIAATGLAIFALDKLSPAAFLTVHWAVLGFVLLALGFALKERMHRIAGFAALACSLLRVVFYDLGKLETLHRILSFIGLGVILLVLAFLYAKNREKIAKWL